MGILNSHHISNYYDFFRDKDIVLNKSNLRALRINPRMIYVKCNGGQWPCIINTTSMQMATILIGTGSGAYVEFNKKENCPVSLKYCFMDSDNNPIQFFVNSAVQEISSYQQSRELALVKLVFTQRPPDDLIERLGEFLQVNDNFNKRHDEKIILTKDSIRELGLPKEESYIFIENVPRKCIIKELYFSGARILFVGVPKFLINKKAQLKLLFLDTGEKITLESVIKDAAFLPNRQDIVMATFEFNKEEIPMSYKFRINKYLTSYSKLIIEKQMQNAKARQEAAEEVSSK